MSQVSVCTVSKYGYLVSGYRSLVSEYRNAYPALHPTAQHRILRLTIRLFSPAVIACFVGGIKSVYERRLLLRNKKGGMPAAPGLRVRAGWHEDGSGHSGRYRAVLRGLL